jgi:hypothetical protein
MFQTKAVERNERHFLRKSTVFEIIKPKGCHEYYLDLAYSTMNYGLQDKITTKKKVFINFRLN